MLDYQEPEGDNRLHKIEFSYRKMHTYSRWLMTRGVVLACLLQALALLLALWSEGLNPSTVYLWDCIDYLSGGAMVTLGTALIGSLLLESILRRGEPGE